MKNIITIAVIVLVVAGASFFGGMKFQQSQRRTGFTAANGQRMGMFTRFGGNADPNNRPVTGQITSSDDKSITVKLADGSSKIVLYSDSTKISKPSATAKTDLTSGTRVFVLGKQNSDGSITADNIQVNFAPAGQ